MPDIVINDVPDEDFQEFRVMKAEEGYDSWKEMFYEETGNSDRLDGCEGMQD